MRVYTGIWLLKCSFTRYCQPELNFSGAPTAIDAWYRDS